MPAPAQTVAQDPSSGTANPCRQLEFSFPDGPPAPYEDRAPSPVQDHSPRFSPSSTHASLVPSSSSLPNGSFLPRDSFASIRDLEVGGVPVVLHEMNGLQRQLFGRLCRFLFADETFDPLLYQASLIVCSLAGPDGDGYRFDAFAQNYPFPEPDEITSSLDEAPYDNRTFSLKSPASDGLRRAVFQLASLWRSSRIREVAGWLEKLNGFDSTLLPEEEEETATDREMRAAAKKS